VGKKARFTAVRALRGRLKASRPLSNLKHEHVMFTGRGLHDSGSRPPCEWRGYEAHKHALDGWFPALNSFRP